MPRWRFIAGAFLALLLALPSASTAQEDDCRTFFPDFDSGCDREFRPEGYIAPMAMPFLFEDPFITTGAQFAVVYHEFPGESALRGGHQTVLALQLRAAITDKLAFIATKDGLTIFRPDTKESDAGVAGSNKDLLDDDEAFYDMTVGFKYKLLDLPDQNFVFTPALRYEIPLGQQSVFQGQGDGVFIPSFSTAWGGGAVGLDDFHVLGSFGAQLPVDDEINSHSLFYNFHFDYAVHEHFVPFFVISGMTWVDGGDGSQKVDTSLGSLPIGTAQGALRTGPFEGVDVANLGSQSMAGHDYVVWGLGFRVPINRNANLGLLYEHPFADSSREITKQRVTFMLAYDF